MVTLRSYQCNFCRAEYSDKSSFRDINDIIGLEWTTRSGKPDKNGKAPTYQILKEKNKEHAENHLCKTCIDAIQKFIPHYVTPEKAGVKIDNAKRLLSELGYEIKVKEGK